MFLCNFTFSSYGHSCNLTSASSKPTQSSSWGKNRDINKSTKLPVIHLKEEKQKELGRWTLGFSILQEDDLCLSTLVTDRLVFPENRRNIIRKQDKKAKVKYKSKDYSCQKESKITHLSNITSIASLKGPQHSILLYIFELEWKYTRTIESSNSGCSWKSAESPYWIALSTWHAQYNNPTMCHNIFRHRTAIKKTEKMIDSSLQEF